jgi:hypothetical protein
MCRAAAGQQQLDEYPPDVGKISLYEGSRSRRVKAVTAGLVALAVFGVADVLLVTRAVRLEPG